MLDTTPAQVLPNTDPSPTSDVLVNGLIGGAVSGGLISIIALIIICILCIRKKGRSHPADHKPHADVENQHGNAVYHKNLQNGTRNGHVNKTVQNGNASNSYREGVENDDEERGGALFQNVNAPSQMGNGGTEEHLAMTLNPGQARTGAGQGAELQPLLNGESSSSSKCEYVCRSICVYLV